MLDFPTELNATSDQLVVACIETMSDLRETEHDSRAERAAQVEKLRDAAEEMVHLLDRYIADAEYE
jgi:hypothetical protein